MPRTNTIKLIFLTLLFALLTSVCSSGYITPASLTQTAAVTAEETFVPTAFFVMPTDSPTPPPTSTPTPDPGLNSPTPLFESPTPLATLPPTSTPISADTPPLLYYAQPGDTLASLANRFGVHPFEIDSPETIPEEGLIDPDQMLIIPIRLLQTTSDQKIIPDSEVVYSPSAIDFDAVTFLEVVEGYLSTYREYRSATGMTDGSEIVQMVAWEQSVNPRLLVSLLEYNSHWVFDRPGSFSEQLYPMRYINTDYQSLYSQLSWAANEINKGYYGWRQGTLTELVFRDGTTLRLAPTLNAGTVGLMYYFSQIVSPEEWEDIIDPQFGFLAQHTAIFGDAWARAGTVEPLIPPDFSQPPLILPFLVGQTWAYTGGPHGAWSVDGAQAALDFAPGSLKHGCAPSQLWAVAAAPGVIARLDEGILILDLDGDGYEQTGWNLFYLHLDTLDSLEEGDWVDKGDLLGNPSCKGGRTTGTHIHIARKYNGEWVLASGPVAFDLSGWQTHAGDEPYEGTLTLDGQEIEACSCGSFSTNIKRPEDPEEGS